MICSLAHLPTTSKPEGWWIERETPGWSLTSTGRVKPHGNAPYLRVKTCPQPFADWMRSVLQGTQDADAGRSSGRAQRSLRCIAISGSAVSGTEATDDTARNYARGVPQSSVTSRHTSSLRLVPRSRSVGHIAPEPCFPLWAALRLWPLGKKT